MLNLNSLLKLRDSLTNDADYIDMLKKRAISSYIVSKPLPRTTKFASLLPDENFEIFLSHAENLITNKVSGLSISKDWNSDNFNLSKNVNGTNEERALFNFFEIMNNSQNLDLLVEVSDLDDYANKIGLRQSSVYHSQDALNHRKALLNNNTDELKQIDDKYNLVYNTRDLIQFMKSDRTIQAPIPSKKAEKSSNFKKRANNYFTDEQIKNAQSKSILDVAHALGYDYKPVGQQGHMRISNVESLKHLELRPESNTFAWYNQDKKGNVIQLYRELTGSTFPEAMTYLLENEFSVSSYVPIEKMPYNNPYNFSETYTKAYHYLVNERKLDFEIIDLLCRKNYIRQETEHDNAVFQWVKFGSVVGSNIKSTNPNSSFKIISSNSESNFGFNIMIGEPSQIKDIYFFEAAVDALSYWSFNKDTIRDTMLVDLEGVKVESFINFQQYAQNLGIRLPDPSHLHICVDRDKVGQDFYNKVNIYVDEATGESLISDDRVPLDSGAKDWNEYLQQTYEPDYLSVNKKGSELDSARIRKRTNGTYLLETYRANNLFQMIDCNDLEQLEKAVEDYDMTRIPHNDLKKFNLIPDETGNKLIKEDDELEA